VSDDFHRGGRVDPGSPEIRTGGMPEIVKPEILDVYSTARLI
jgi:hypothetical protein